MARTKSAEPSKRKLVAEALQAKGDVGPRDLQAYIKEKHGYEIAVSLISAYKSQILRPSGSSSEPKKRGRKPGRSPGRPAATAASSTASMAASAGAVRTAGGEFDFSDIETAQRLIKRLGSAKAGQLIQVLARS